MFDGGAARIMCTEINNSLRATIDDQNTELTKTLAEWSNGLLHSLVMVFGRSVGRCGLRLEAWGEKDLDGFER